MIRRAVYVLAFSAASALLACGTDMSGGSGPTGGRADTGGAPSGGGTGGGATGGTATGGSGAAPSTGGAPQGSGGSAKTGGTSGGGSGGAGGRATGGASTGGNPSCTPPTPPTAKDSVTLDMGMASGAPTYKASGFIYGVSRDGAQPPNARLTDMKVQALRCGGAQIGCPNGGFVNGQYAARWDAVKAYYAKAKAVGATLLILVHDIWGADAVCKVPRWPGQGGDWTEYTTFINQLVTDAKTAGMTSADVRWELWNEPDYSGFWGGTQAQWLEMWKRGYQLIRAAFPDAIIEGPSLAGGIGGGWANAFLDYVKTNNVVPDYLGWHEAGGGGDPANDGKTARAALDKRGLTVKGLNISEYGSQTEQNPGHSAWFIAKIERAGLQGLRSNWGSGGGLYAGMGDLVTSSWQPLGQWWVYKRYADQTGLRTTVTAGSQVDAVAYQEEANTKAIAVVGNHGGTTGAVNVVIKNIPGWLQSGGMTKVLVERMADGSAALTAPQMVSEMAVTVTCNGATVTLDWSKATDAYAVTLTPR